MALGGLPHRVIRRLLDSEQNWEWLFANADTTADSRPPSGPAGGGLTGTYPNPTLASPNNSVYRTTLLASAAIPTADIAAGTYVMRNGIFQTSPNTSSVGGFSSSGIGLLHFVAADYAVPGKSTKLRLRAQVGVNGTACGITFTFGLYPITVSGAADEFTYTLGTVVSGTTAAIASPVANTITGGASTDATPPADGMYAFGCVTSGTLTNNCMVSLSAQLQMRHV